MPDVIAGDAALSRPPFRSDIHPFGAPASGRLAVSDAAVMGNFVNLGDNAELDLVQRSLGWTNAAGLIGSGGLARDNIDGLLKALAERFSGLAVRDQLAAERFGAVWVIRSLAYDIAFLTTTPAALPAEDAIKIEMSRLARAIPRAIDTLTTGARICVVKHNQSLDIAVYEKLFRAIRAYGDTTLLVLARDETGDKAGQVEVIERGFLKGYIQQFARYEEANDFRRHAWVDVCRAALDVWRPWRLLEPLLPAQAPSRGVSARAIARSFISLGDNREFGLVQRALGWEGPDLLRSASTRGVMPIIRLIAQRFAELRDDEKVGIATQGGEWIALCGNAKFYTAKKDDQFPQEEVLREQQAGLRSLAAKAVDDIVAGEKVFVVKSVIPVAEDLFLVLFRVLRELGPRATLLWVAPADAAHPAASVEVLEDGFLKGYVERFAPSENPSDYKLESWLDLLRAAYDVRFGGAAPRGDEA